VVEIIYIDGGSRDNSIAIANNIGAVKTVALNLKNPTPGRQRNEGWRIAKGELVQFLDSDTQINPLWLYRAVESMNNQIAAVFGDVKELHPDKNWFHFIADIEWNVDWNMVIKNKYFAGNVLIRRSALENTAGYSDNLIAGEDYELSFRIREKGGQIKRIDVPMSYHDIGMHNIFQYVKRCFRTGYGLAIVGGILYIKREYSFIKNSVKIVIKTTGTLIFLFLAYLSKNIFFLFIALALNIMPIIKIPLYKKHLNISFKKSAVYALHIAFSAYPAMVGIFRYYLVKMIHWPSLASNKLL
jgi:glycosyltransferase involved in cell wall biosynthesis